MNLGLKGLKWNSFAVNTDVAALPGIARNDAVRRHLAVCHEGAVEELARIDCQLEADRLERRHITVGRDKVHEAVVRESRREEIGVGCHVGHLKVD